MKKNFIFKQIIICLFSFVCLLFSAWFIWSDNTNILINSLNHTIRLFVGFSALINFTFVCSAFIISFSNIFKYGNDNIFRALKENE